MTLQDLGQKLKEEYELLKKYRDELWGKTEIAVQAKETLEAKRCTILVTSDPKALGSNEDQRNAKLWSLCQKEEQAFNNADYLKREVAHRVQNCLNQIEYLRAQLRIFELDMSAA